MPLAQVLQITQHTCERRGPSSLHISPPCRCLRHQGRYLSQCPAVEHAAVSASSRGRSKDVKPMFNQEMAMKHKAQVHELVLLPAFVELLCCTADGSTDTSYLQCRVPCIHPA